MNFSTRITELLGIRYPIVQAGMSWASSNAELALAVSQAGGLGVIGAGPMYPDDLRAAIRKVKAGTDNPYAVNVPLYNKRAATFLDIVLEEKVPIMVALAGRAEAAHRAVQGGRREVAARHRLAGAREKGGRGGRRRGDRGRRRGRRASAAGRGRHARRRARVCQGGEAFR